MNKKWNLQAEEQAGFWVSEKRKRLWAAEMEMLEVFIEICNRHDLNYYVCGGTLLGAARHKGYIPWDDDLDVAMYRDDYEKFLTVAQQELPRYMFLQTMETDPTYYMFHAKIRNSNTTAIRTSEWKKRRQFNQGVFLDIFPFDFVPDGKIRRKIFCERISIIRKISNNAYRDKATDKIGPLASVLKLFSKVVPYRSFMNHAYSVITKYNKKNQENVAPVSVFNDKLYYPFSVFSDQVACPFEYLTVKVPREYDACLTNQYGDWRKYVVSNGYHGGLVIDTERSYKEYMKFTDEQIDNFQNESL